MMAVSGHDGRDRDRNNGNEVYTYAAWNGRFRRADGLLYAYFHDAEPWGLWETA